MIEPKRATAAAEVGDHYDELDAAYRAVWGEHVHHGYWRTGRESPAEAVEALVELVAQRLALASGQKVCDIGCGYGAPAEMIAARHGASVTGLTLSAAQLEIAQARRPAAGSLAFHRRDWLDNGLPDAAFDAAYAIESSEHMADKARFLAEAFRVLRPGGRLAVCAWLASENPRPWQVRRLLEPICREGRLAGLASRSEYQALAAQAGFVALAHEDLTKAVRRTWSICARRILGRLAADPALRRLAFSPATRNRDFLLSIPRLIVAMRIGAMRYGLFAWQKPDA